MRTATLLLILCPLFAQDAPPLPEGASLDIVVMEVTGEVDVRNTPGEKWGPAAAGQRLSVGAKICTGVGSSTVVAFGTNSVALVTEATLFEIRRYAMDGDKLVAQVFIDPGVTRVSVKQVAQFQTDFQVSTPRLTCSVKGTVTQVEAPGDEEPHKVFMFDGTGHVTQDSGQERTITRGETTNSENQSSNEIATRESVAGTTPYGSTAQETQDGNLLANTSQSLEIDTGSLTTNTDSSPSGNDVSDAPPPDEGTVDPPSPHTMDLVLMTLNAQDATVHAADDIPGEDDGETGVDGAERQAFLDILANQGIDAFLDEFLAVIHDDFHNGAAQLEQQDPPLFADRHDLFHDDLPEAGFNALSTYLRAAAIQTVADPLDARDATLILASIFHTDFHIIHSSETPQVFDPLHTEFHTEGIDPVLQAILETRHEDALALWGALVHSTWHEATDCDDFLDGQDICFGPHQHFETRLIETGQNVRAVTETFGIQTEQEELMVHTYLNHADLRGHSRDADDIFEFDIRHDRMDFEHNALSVTGLAAGVKNFDAADAHDEFHDDPQGLQATNPSLFDARHTDFHVSDSVFGLDNYIAFWNQVAEEARNQTIDPMTLGHALIAGIDIDFLRANYALPAGSSPGQYDFEFAQFHQNVTDPMHAQVDGGQFAPFIHTYRDFLHDRWHQVTGVPQNVQQGQTGFEAHQHLHDSLDVFHTQVHDATGVPDP